MQTITFKLSIIHYKYYPLQISTDNNYVEPAEKQTCANKWGQVVDEFRVFKMLDQLTVTAPGIDGLPHWFLRQAAPSICSPITHLFNLSLLTSTVPCQWKTSVITPVAKTKQPTQCSDYRPISISPILSRLLEKIVVRDYIYPIFTHSTTRHLFQDQFAFRPTGSPTSAIIHLTQRVSDLLQEHQFVHVIAWIFPRHLTLCATTRLCRKWLSFQCQICL